MAWSNLQKSLLMQACKAVKVSDEQRKMIMSRLDNARDKHGRITATSPKLNNGDYEYVMAVLERMMPYPHQLPLRHKDSGKCRWPGGYWQDQMARELDRMRVIAIKRVALLSNTGLEKYQDKQASMKRFITWMTKNREESQTDDLMVLDYTWLQKVLNGLSSACRRHHINPYIASEGSNPLNSAERETIAQMLGVDPDKLPDGPGRSV